MPTQTVLVAGVTHRNVQIRGRFVTRYEVYTRPKAGSAWSEKFSTLDAWKGALCERAQTQNRPVVIGSRDTPYGPEIVTVELAEKVGAA